MTKLSLARAIPIIRKPAPSCATLQQPFAAAAAAASSSSSCLTLKPKTPLFLRPPKHSATLSDLNKWHDWAKTLASSVGSTFANLDGGPDSSILCRELKWLLEDSLEDPSLIPQLGIVNNHHQTVRLRIELDELYGLWNERTEKRKPFQYLVGCEHWRDLVLSVEEGVFIPRPETELMVDLVSDEVRNCEDLRNGLWVDLGTGSGAIAIGVGRVLGNKGRVIAVDLNPLATAVAAFNVQRYCLQEIVEIRQGSWFEKLKDVEGKLSGVVSNPPYIPHEDISGLQAEVGKHEPRLALDGGLDGMDDLLHVCDGAASMLKPGGFFAFETNGEKQCKFLVDYLQNGFAGNFCKVNIVSDFAGIQRFVTGYRQ